jgi:hypothetical protein
MANTMNLGGGGGGGGGRGETRHLLRCRLTAVPYRCMTYFQWEMESPFFITHKKKKLKKYTAVVILTHTVDLIHPLYYILLSQ